MKRSIPSRLLTALLSILLAISPGLSGVAMAEEIDENAQVVNLPNESVDYGDDTQDMVGTLAQEIENDDAPKADEDLAASVGLADAESSEFADSEAPLDEGLGEEDPLTVVNTQSDSDAAAIEQVDEPNDQNEAKDNVVVVDAEANKATPVLSAVGYVRGRGTVKATKGPDGVTIGSAKSGMSLTGMKLKVINGTISYKAYVQGVGWQEQKVQGELAGSGAKGKLLQAIEVTLPAELSQTWSVRYRCYTTSKGWMGWAADGAVAGITKSGEYAIEAIEIRIVTKNQKTPRGGGKAWLDSGLVASAHVQSIGWQEQKSGYNVCIGSTGKGLRLEALKISRSDGIDARGSIVYKAHVQSVGWQGKRSDGGVAGTQGRGLRVEAISVRLTGELGRQFDIWYRLHVSDAGWLGWACNGENAGTEGLSLRVEAIQLVLVRKGEGMPSIEGQDIATPFISNLNVRYAAMANKTWTSWISNGKSAGSANGSAIKQLKLNVSGDLAGSVKYSVHLANLGWQKYVGNGAVAASNNKDIQAVRIKITGELARVCDVWYSCYVKDNGWTGWASNGANVGSVGLGKPILAIRVCLRSRAQGAPGSTTLPCFKPFTSGDKELDAILETIVKNVTGTGSGALRKGFDYVSSFPYRGSSEAPASSWQTWSVGFAKDMYRNHSGNCYRYASLMCWIARRLGYDARVISGTVMSSRLPHGWCEIVIDGKTYIIDPDLQWEIRTRNFYLITYENAPVYYFK